MVSLGHMSLPEDSLGPSCEEQLALSECLMLSPTSRPVCPGVTNPRPRLSLFPLLSVLLILPHLSRCWHMLLQRAFPEPPAWEPPLPSPLRCARVTSIRMLSCWVISPVSLSGFPCPLRTRPRLDSSLNFQYWGVELAHFSFSKCLLSKGMENWTNELNK